MPMDSGITSQNVRAFPSITFDAPSRLTLVVGYFGHTSARVIRHINQALENQSEAAALLHVSMQQKTGIIESPEGRGERGETVAPYECHLVMDVDVRDPEHLAAIEHIVTSLNRELTAHLRQGARHLCYAAIDGSGTLRHEDSRQQDLTRDLRIAEPAPRIFSRMVSNDGADASLQIFEPGAADLDSPDDYRLVISSSTGDNGEHFPPMITPARLRLILDAYRALRRPETIIANHRKSPPESPAPDGEVELPWQPLVLKGMPPDQPDTTVTARQSPGPVVPIGRGRSQGDAVS